MKLFSVPVEFSIMVIAADEEEALDVAQQNFSEEAANHSDDLHFPRQITSVDNLPEGWTESCIPWGGDGTLTCGEILENKDRNEVTNAG